MKMSLVRRLAKLASIALLCLFPLSGAWAGLMDTARAGRTSISPSKMFQGASSFSAAKEVDASADLYEYVGDNLIARGHVVIKYGDMTITADKAIINLESRDLEATGHVTFIRRQKISRLVDYQEYQELLDDYSLSVKILEYVKTPIGLRRIKVEIENIAAYMKADRISGNLTSGLFQFRNFALKNGPLFFAAAEAERAVNGKITVRDAKISTCDYIMDDHAHYALGASKAVLYPREFESGLQNYNPDHNDHAVLAYNTMFRLWDVPVFWLPALYKPFDSDSFGIDFDFGSTSDWGYFIRASKGFSLVNTPKMQLNAAAIVNYYSDRGMAYGGKVNFLTDNSRTEIFGVMMRDRKPYESFSLDNWSQRHWYKEHARLKIPETRYDFKASNLTHITPSLDFRGQIEVLSDYNFLEDYYDTRYRENIQPPTYAALEYQMERASAALLTTIRVNDFDTVVQRLPEARWDMPRQELFGGLYYQSETTGGYYEMKWRHLDNPGQYGRVKNYASARFDTVHFLYYPINLDFLNIIPRMGGRFTAYSNSSKNKISDEDLSDMFGASALEVSYFSEAVKFKNFQNSGKARFRFVGELGVEANTKIYRTWQDVRSSMLQLDGLRHVMMPYVNYTYIPEPTEDPDYLLYFDDIDRIDEQNFVRIGLQNTLQTRRGNYGSEQVVEWASLDTYWDFHGNRQGMFGHVGDLGIRLSLTPFENLTISSELLWDVGQNNEHNEQVRHAFGREAGRVGLMKLKYLNMWNTSFSYRISKDWRIYGSYIYSDAYRQRGTFSMGSMMEQINATSSTLSAAYPTAQDFTLGLDFPTYIDPRLKGGVKFTYDVEAALMKNMAFYLKRNFHCVDVILEAGRSQERDGNQDKDESYYVMFFVSLSTMPQVGFGQKQGL